MLSLRFSPVRPVAICVVWTLLFGLLSHSAFAADRWAAIAFSFKTRQRGYSTGMSSRAAAERLAVANTKATDAKVVAVARNAWAALATSNRGNGAGTGVSLSKATAINQAFKNCPDSGGKKLAIIIFAGK